MNGRWQIDLESATPGCLACRSLLPTGVPSRPHLSGIPLFPGTEPCHRGQIARFCESLPVCLHGRPLAASSEKKLLTSEQRVYNLRVMEPIGYRLVDSTLDAAFGALADPTRRALLSRLAAGEATVNELAEPFEMSQPAISKHLKVLERAGLISRGRDAQRRPARAEMESINQLNDWLRQYRKAWEANFSRLDSLLGEMTAISKGEAK
jgi:DNA-binding transcriptional ArsR family regulator